MPKMIEQAPVEQPGAKPVKAPANGKKQERPIKYPELKVNGIPIPREKLRITAAMMKQMLGWETEEDYVNRKIKENPKAKAATFKFGEHYLLLDSEKRKVRCWYNEEYVKRKDPNTGEMAFVLGKTNRFLRQGHHDKLEQEILQGRWRFNGETIIVGETGQCISIQHRGTALVTAVEKWHKNPEAYPYWKEEPYIEALVVVGVSEDAETLRTVDNVLSRSLTDVFFTSPLFEGMTPNARQDCSNIMSAAVSLLWRRTQVSEGVGLKVIQTHSESIEFSNRHPKLYQCVKHVYDEKGDYALQSNLGLSLGEIAGLMYLMAASESDVDKYRLGNPPREKLLDMSNYDKASDFIVEMASGSKEGPIVAQAIKDLSSEANLGKVPKVQKVAIIVKAWQHFVQNHELTAEDLDLSGDFHQDPADGKWSVTKPVLIGGIDLGEKFIAPEPEDDPEEIENGKEEVKNGNGKVARGKQLAEIAEKAQRDKAEKAKAARSSSKK